jgi:hypothetical protein
MTATYPGQGPAESRSLPDTRAAPWAERFLYPEWGPIIAGAIAAAALSLVLHAFALAIGLAVSSTAPTWRDASFALVLLSGLYILLAAIAAFGLGGYLAGLMRARPAAPEDTDARRHAWPAGVGARHLIDRGDRLGHGAIAHPSRGSLRRPGRSVELRRRRESHRLRSRPLVSRRAPLSKLVVPTTSQARPPGGLRRWRAGCR